MASHLSDHVWTIKDVVAVIYGPLVAHYAEWKLFGSSHVAEFLQAIGVLDVLEFIYDNTPGIRH